MGAIEADERDWLLVTQMLAMFAEESPGYWRDADRLGRLIKQGIGERRGVPAPDLGEPPRSDMSCIVVTPAMVKAGEAVLDRVFENVGLAPSFAVFSALPDVYGAMAVASRGQARSGK